MNLALKFRPKKLNQILGQRHIIEVFAKFIENKTIPHSIFFGNAGSGKTTLARVIAGELNYDFYELDATSLKVEEIRKILARYENSLYKPLMFIDEIHRLSKTQQEVLLIPMENYRAVIIGATTENPYFEVNKALLSRSRVFEMHPLGHQSLRMIMNRALKDEERGYGKLNILIDEDACDLLIERSNSDARNLLNAVELAVESTPPDENGLIHITLSVAEDSIQERALNYDKKGDSHYDTISAFIKSVRGSDPDAALYWVSKMLLSGEDPHFILRRLIILACEDIGMADPRALQVAISAATAFDYVGMPEGYYPIAEAVLYCATAPKSNSACGIFSAMDKIKKEGAGPVPTHLMDPSRDAQALGHGQGYKYPHNYPEHHIKQQYLPKSVTGGFYVPSDQGYEKIIRERMEHWGHLIQNKK